MEGSTKGEAQLLNHIIILIKYMILKNSRNTKDPPTLNHIKEKIQEDRLEERKLAEQRGLLTNHFRKWDKFIF